MLARPFEQRRGARRPLERWPRPPAVDLHRGSTHAGLERAQPGLDGLAVRDRGDADVDEGGRLGRDDVLPRAAGDDADVDGHPACGIVSACKRRTRCASASIALAPPPASAACAARPVTAIRKRPRPLRAVFRWPAEVGGSHTNAAAAPSAARARSSRAVGLPISSSAVTTTRSGCVVCARRTASSSTTSPPFMSYAPGPYARPSSMRHGIAWSVPRGHTVSRWPRSTSGGPLPPSCA